MSGSEQKDISIIFPGLSRAVVIAMLGSPENTTKDENGCYTDSFIIVKGNAPSISRAIMHGALNIVSHGFWEVTGTTFEMRAARENFSRVIIVYDKDDNVEDVQQIKVEKRTTIEMHS